MSNYTEIDLSTWKRKDQFEFFRSFSTPTFNVTAQVDVTRLRELCRERGESFFLSSLYLALRTTNEIENFRYRLVGEKVHLYEAVHAGATILREDETFMYATLEHQNSRAEFMQMSHAAIAEQKEKRGFKPHHRPDMVFFSILPLVSFSSVSHAMDDSPNVCIPRIVFGKYFAQDSRLRMPVAVQVHHALADGYHVGQFFQQFQDALDTVR